jgi:hypothetical protein
MIEAIKDLPIRAIPFVIFLGGALGFGELFVRMPTVTALHEIMSGVMFSATIASSILFFSKLIAGWPPMHGLELID